MTTTSAQRLALFERMLLIRAYEERAVRLAKDHSFPGICSSLGQEAAAVGVVAALGPDDKILTNHRSVGHLLARGADPGRIMAESMGRSTGYCKGKSGFLHVSAKELGVVLTSTIVGGELSMAPGVALAKQQLGEPGIVACFFGDGAACEGIFHEALNLAAVWKLPLLFVCENNQWQAYVHRKETMVGDFIAPWAASYGMGSETVDGNDVEAVYAAACDAVDNIRRTGMPYLLELNTFRQRPHLEPDEPPQHDLDERAYWMGRDPIARMETRMLNADDLDRTRIAALRSAAEARIDAALQFAKDSPFPDVAELTTEVYAD
ncbi:thiamine pyrophosphate-dependent dehydrogenase E1 component subunit alpha [Massilia sp. TS11]|uniref:thiamine pyrophosphate-dependent dehydrogenase E1 component subunit alpha n=1 Tax=Massilia sp. TS11 TaxID=2908003 RepID=UPI001EDC6B96|nr:thiamine pyrophosphate-dependent dehydrogenase E1 component subunit alpha [Massilia sp. TS11]MCG2583779.1 thiamine pyrophosphate-dependent dehydrogenase E1 component subunit alpha [Massilia sp. TS11]